MKSTFLRSIFLGLMVLFVSNPIAAQVGEWTKCIAWSKDTKYNIVHGGWSVDVCFALAQKCTKDPGVSSQHYSNPVIVEPPYLRCTERWNWRTNDQTEVQEQAFDPQNAFCRARCQRKAAQCYRGCDGSSDFIKCTDECDEEWARCENACISNAVSE